MGEGFLRSAPMALRASQEKVIGMYVSHLSSLDLIGAVKALKRGLKALPPGAESITILLAGKVWFIDGPGAVCR